MTADLQHYILSLCDPPNSGWLEGLICITITTKNGSPLVSSVCTSLLSHWLTVHSQAVQRISIRIEITVKIHMLRLTRLVDLLHPRYQIDLFFQGKQLWTVKVDKHFHLFLSYYRIRHPEGSYQSQWIWTTFTVVGTNITCAHLQVQILPWVWWRRMGLSGPFSARPYHIHHKIPSPTSSQALLVPGAAAVH